jgi:cyclic pyranopterin phosphate synthase
MVDLVRALGRHLGEGGLRELTLTTNGTRLAEFAEDLALAGVRRINVSLDTLDRDRFAALARRDSLHRCSKGWRRRAPPASRSSSMPSRSRA